MKKFTFVSLILVLAFVLGACSSTTSTTPLPTATQPGVTETSIPTNTVAVIPTETATPLPTPTKTPEATSTVELMNINIDLKNVDVDKLPVITMNDIESGKLTETELALYKSGQIKNISKEAKPISNNVFKIYAVGGGALAINLMSKPDANPELRSYTPTSVNAIEIDGKKLLTYGEAYLNRDGTVGVLHYAVESYKDLYVLSQITHTLSGEYFPAPFLTMKSTVKLGRWFVAAKEPTMNKLYINGNDERTTLANEWVTTGNIPENLSKMLLIPSMDHLDVPL